MATIHDVADDAGVSAATVSRVLNGNPNVRADLARSVRRSVEKLGYRPNGIARGLRRMVNSIVGLVVPDIENPFFTRLLRGVEDVAVTRNYSVLVGNSDEDLEKERRYLTALRDQWVAGVIIAPANEETSDIRLLAERGTPVVAVDRRLRNADVDSVLTENVAAAQGAVEALLARGCRRIAHIAGPHQTTTGSERRQGYEQALRAAGLVPDPALTVDGSFRVEGGYAGMRALLDQDARPDGVFVANNLMALGALRQCRERTLEPAQQVQLAVFDELPWGTEGPDTMPVVVQQAHLIGRQAMQCLLDRLDEPTKATVQIRVPAVLR